MTKNYIKIGCGNLRKNKTFLSINGTTKFSITIILICFGLLADAQENVIIPGLYQGDSDVWMIHNREYTANNGVVHLNGMPDDGLLWLTDVNFVNGHIELDIKGKDERGKSFVGLAFHGENDSIFDAIYFRPFNFKSPDRNGHSVQYISSPDFPWFKLREDHPGKYENAISPVPDPEAWIHAEIVVEYPVVKVFVNDSDEPSLIINQLSGRKKGWIGFWVGSNSEGWFKNLKITPKP